MSNTAESRDDDISTASAPKLSPKWVATLGGDVSARAGVADDIAYVPDWGGYIWAINAKNGNVVWSHRLSDYGLAAGALSRTSPTIADGVLYIGTQWNQAANSGHGDGGWLLAIDASNGILRWKMQPHPTDANNGSPVITASPVVADGVVFVGMTSNEEYAAGDPSYPCCSERGSVVAVDVGTHKVRWETFTVPPGYSGGNVWGSSPVVDRERNTIFVGTGNNYSEPAAYTTCISGGGTPATCLDPNDHVDSVLALDARTGAIRWAKRLMTWNQRGVANDSDFWNVACFTKPFTNCPAAAGPDYDFASAPNEITYRDSDGRRHTIIGAGQKSGIYYALDPDTGSLLWQTEVGPGSSLGGMEWGSASDGTRIYVAIANLYGIPYGPSCDFTTFAGCWTGGSWAALDPATGAILWQTPDPNGALDLGPLAVDNGVVFAPSAAVTTPTVTPATAPTMVALDASTGAPIWSFASGSSSIAGASMVDGTIFWGTGYARFAQLGLTGGNQFFAFTTKRH